MESDPTPVPQPDDPQTPQEPDSAADVIRRLGPAAWLGVAWALVPAIAGVTLLVRIRSVSERLVDLAGHGGADLYRAVAVYVAAFVVLSGAGLLPTFSVSVLGGHAFGVPVGFAAALAGFGGASVVGYLIARTVGRAKVEAEIQRHDKARIVRDALIGCGFARTLMIVTLVRVPPNSPFALMNGTLAATGVRLPAYVLGTLIGMAPRTLAYVVIGSQVTDWSDPARPKWLFVAGIALTVLALLVIGSIANRALQRVTGPGRG